MTELRDLVFTVYGIPKPQGSKRAFVNPKTGRAIVVDDNKVPLKDWRSDVVNTALDAQDYGYAAMTGPVVVTLAFAFDRPKSHHGSGRNADVLKASAPAHHTTKPDVDKLTRAMLDAMTTAGVYGDDSQVVELRVTKSYTERGERPGCAVIVTELPPVSAAASVGEAPGAAADTTPTLFDQ